MGQFIPIPKGRGFLGGLIERFSVTATETHGRGENLPHARFSPDTAMRKRLPPATVSQARLDLISSPSSAFFNAYCKTVSEISRSNIRLKEERVWLIQCSSEEEKALELALSQAEASEDVQGFIEAHNQLTGIRGRVVAIKDVIYARRLGEELPDISDTEAVTKADFADKDPFKEEGDDEAIEFLRRRPTASSHEKGRAQKPVGAFIEFT